MQSPQRDRHQDRAQASEAARKLAQKRFAALLPRHDDPAVIAKTAARVALAEARQERIAAREAERRALAEAEALEAARVAAAAKAEAEAARAMAEAAERELAANAIAAKAKAVALLKEQKLVRDARYAARQARRK